MGRRLPLFLALVVALFVGVVPLRVCLAQDAGGQGVGGMGVVVLGTHSHHGHADGSGCAHDDECDSDEHHDADHDADQEADDCCVDSPFHAVSHVSVVSADRALDSSVIVFASLAIVPFVGEGATQVRVHEPAPPDVREPVPTGIVSTVLLR